MERGGKRKAERGDAKRQKEKKLETKARLIALGLLTVPAAANFALKPVMETAGNAWSSFTEQFERGSARRAARHDEVIAGYRALYGGMEENRVLFIDSEGRPVGGPLEPLLETSRKGEVHIAQRWLDAERARMCEMDIPGCDVENGTPRIIHSVGQSYEGSGYLTQIERYGIQRVQPLPDVMGVQEGSNLSRIQFVHRFLERHLDIGESAVVEEIVELAPGLMGKESTFHNALTSSAGATRALQVMPETRESLGFTEESTLYLRNQVPLMGAVFNEKYRAIDQGISRDVQDELTRDYFGGDRDAFLREFMVPMTINSYNAGQGTMLQVFERFRQRYPTREAFEAVHGTSFAPLGLDLFTTMSFEAYQDETVPNYGIEAHQYYFQVVALAREMRERGLY